SAVLSAVNHVYSYASPGDVVNMSLGGGISSTLDNAVLRASNRGIYFTLAAGNESQNANNVSPARVNGSYIWTVSAFDINDRFASFSNFANPPIDVSEPGVQIVSTYLNGSYATLSGTSMATPHLAGLILQRSVRNGGRVTGDRDNNPDIIGVK
ncbi:MAG: S8 family serine peptidase, partial [Pseudomonadota bacterium]|nr:S8 family serine peptidase [Pseudomonadota bacterium]